MHQENIVPGGQKRVHECSEDTSKMGDAKPLRVYSHRTEQNRIIPHHQGSDDSSSQNGNPANIIVNSGHSREQDHPALHRSLDERTNHAPKMSGRRRSFKARRRELRKTQPKHTQLKVGFFNAQGKMGKNNKEVWKSVNNILLLTNWNILGICETHWFGGIQGVEVPGYTLFQAQRNVTAKKGGGLILYVKNEMESFLIDPPRPETTPNYVQSEILWMGLNGQQQKMAIGLIYLPCKPSSDWKETLHLTLKADIEYLHTQDFEILLMGDFNGHTKLNDTHALEGLDVNGKLIAHLHNENILTTLNYHPNCQGKFTWTRKDQKSQIDYALASPNLLQNFTHMIIDEDQERWSIGSDHCMVETSFVWEYNQSEDIHDTNRKWHISQNTNWTQYQSILEEQLSTSSQQNKTTNRTNPLQLHKTIIDSIIFAADNSLPKYKGKLTNLKYKNLKKYTYHRNKLGKRWRKALFKNSDHMGKKWNQFVEAKRKAKHLHTKEKQKRTQQFFKTVIQEGRNSSPSFWRQFKTKNHKIHALKGKNGTTTHPKAIT